MRLDVEVGCGGSDVRGGTEVSWNWKAAVMRGGAGTCFRREPGFYPYSFFPLSTLYPTLAVFLSLGVFWICVGFFVYLGIEYLWV